MTISNDGNDDTNALQMNGEHQQQQQQPIHFLRKMIIIGNRKHHILLQDANGPCPLVSIFNCLMLRGTKIPGFDERCASVTDSELVMMLADVLCERLANSSKSSSASAAHSSTTSAAAVDDVMKLLPNMKNGLDINIKFTGCRDVEWTAELSVFQLLNLHLVHGWIVDMQDHETAHALRDLSYNGAVEKVILMDDLLSMREKQTEQTTEKAPNTATIGSLSQVSKPEDLLLLPEEKQWEIIHQGQLINAFLESTPTQMSYAGLAALHSNDVGVGLAENQLGILFRNNHFSTIVKHGGRLYVLCTDEGFMHQPELIWEGLQDLHGHTSDFYNGQFQPYQHDPRASVPRTMADAQKMQWEREENLRRQQEEQDRAFALRLQQSDDEEARIQAHQQQQQQPQLQQPNQPVPVPAIPAPQQEWQSSQQHQQEPQSRIPTIRERREIEQRYRATKPGTKSNDRYANQAAQLRQLNAERAARSTTQQSSQEQQQQQQRRMHKSQSQNGNKSDGCSVM